ncbi:MAG: class I SAM-dependent methyltransferase [Flavobacteriales bacterium]|nr:class I SAM-dependent methyltransferase [Flavobacteriales bacterium]
MNELFASFPLVNGVRLVSDHSDSEERYAIVREKEKRILSDTAVRALPNGRGLWNEAEWRIRSRSAKRLLRALTAQGHGLRILEVGCGNGWLSALLHAQGHHVLGIDVFTKELEQAARVFPSGPVFARCDPFHSALPLAYFDVVVFAASIQYFADAAHALERALTLLRPGGTVHVLDSILYASKISAQAAEERSLAYFAGLRMPAMAQHYSAHTLAALRGPGTLRILAAPSPFDRMLRIFGGGTSPFTHAVLHKS